MYDELSATAQTDWTRISSINKSIDRSIDPMECCYRGGMRPVLWPTKNISVNEKCNNHGIQIEKSDTVLPVNYEVSQRNNVLFPQLKTFLFIICHICK